MGSYLTFEDYKCKAILIGFDHNMDLETEGKHNITLQFGQDENGVNIAFIDSRYNNTGGLCMNNTGTNKGGWESSYMRNNICPQFLELLPSGLQGIISETTKYTDNVGGVNQNTKSNITATKDKIFLLSHYELDLTGSDTNSYEANYTEPYSEMYSGNSDRIKYRHSAPASTCNVWNRSPYRSNSSYFERIGTSGGAAYSSANYSAGFSPAFTIY